MLALKKDIESWDRKHAVTLRRAYNSIVLSGGGKCQLDSVGNMVRKYLQEGWESQADLFEQSRSCKERCVRSDAKRQKNLALRLEFLGALRKMIVDNLFECANDQPNKTIYKAFGSTNLTSDYDLTILGPNAPSVIEKMPKAYKSQYNTSLPHAFDSNIYCTGYYSAKGSNLLGHRVPPHLHPRRRLPRRLCTAATAQRQHAWRLVPLARGFVPPDLGAAATLTLQGSCVLIFRARRERIIEPIARRSRVRGKNGRRFFPL